MAIMPFVLSILLPLFCSNIIVHGKSTKEETIAVPEGSGDLIYCPTESQSALQTVVLFDVSPENAIEFEEQKVRTIQTLRHIDLFAEGRPRIYELIIFHRVAVRIRRNNNASFQSTEVEKIVQQISSLAMLSILETSPSKAFEQAKMVIEKLPEAKSIVLLVHDGHNTDLVSDTLSVSTKLSANNVSIFAIAGGKTPPALAKLVGYTNERKRVYAYEQDAEQFFDELDEDIEFCAFLSPSTSNGTDASVTTKLTVKTTEKPIKTTTELETMSTVEASNVTTVNAEKTTAETETTFTEEPSNVTTIKVEKTAVTVTVEPSEVTTVKPEKTSSEADTTVTVESSSEVTTVKADNITSETETTVTVEPSTTVTTEITVVLPKIEQQKIENQSMATAEEVLKNQPIEGFSSKGIKFECSTNGQVDLVLLLDTSGSMFRAFTREAMLVKNILTSMAQPIREGQLRVGLINFAVKATVAFSLGEKLNQTEQIRRVDAIEFSGGTTQICNAIEKGMQEFDKFGRKGALKIFVLITDGHGQDVWPRAKMVGEALRKQQMQRFAVSLSPDYNINELELYTSDSNRVFAGLRQYSFEPTLLAFLNECLHKGSNLLSELETIETAERPGKADEVPSSNAELVATSSDQSVVTEAEEPKTATTFLEIFATRQTTKATTTTTTPTTTVTSESTTVASTGSEATAISSTITVNEAAETTNQTQKFEEIAAPPAEDNSKLKLVMSSLLPNFVNNNINNNNTSTNSTNQNNRKPALPAVEVTIERPIPSGNPEELPFPDSKSA